MLQFISVCSREEGLIIIEMEVCKRNTKLGVNKKIQGVPEVFCMECLRNIEIERDRGYWDSWENKSESMIEHVVSLLFDYFLSESKITINNYY